MPYDINEHKHRYAAWAASRAASTKGCRFNVLQGKSIIEQVGLKALLSNPENLPSPRDIDAQHRRWRDSAIQAAKERDITGFSHGVAAKLINVYLKSAFVCAGHELHPKVAALHPPIDSLLLDSLYEENAGNQKEVWGRARQSRWSKFDSGQYQAVIEGIRGLMNGRPLWQAEEYWRGYR